MASKKTVRMSPNATARHLWLAGLGVASIAGRQTAATAAQAVDRAAQARRQVIAAVGQVQSNLTSAAGELRSRVESGVAQAGNTLDAALSPLVAKFAPKARRSARRGRKPAVKSVRRAGKKTAVAKRARKA